MNKAMRKCLFVCAAALLAFGEATAAAQSDKRNASAWSGVIVYSSCNADEAFNESPECFKNAPGATLALYDDTSRVMYGLEPQQTVAGHLGDIVTVHGTLEDDMIHVTRLELLSVGLAVGQKAPEFSLRDQSGQVQTLESLRGKNGTILLFFRSADW